MEPLKAVTFSEPLDWLQTEPVFSIPEFRTDMCPSYGGEGFFSVKSSTAVKVKLCESPRRSRGFTYSNYSEGLSLPELAEIIVRYNGYTALNLDGGGSVTLVMEDADGKPVVLNSPVHGRVPPGRERPVANHLGIFATPITG